MEALGINFETLAASIIGFVLLWMLLAKVLFKPVLALLATRQQDIKSTYDAAESAKSEALQIKSDLEQKIAGIEAEARTRIQAAIKEGQDAKDEIVAEARAKAEDLLKRGQEDLDREREKTLAGIREQVVDLSLGAAGKLIGSSLDDAKHRQLVTDFIDRIGAA